jgi:hypothetical protein
LHHAIAGASNDDLSEPQIDKRERHVHRIQTMHDAITVIAALRASPPPGYKNCAEFLAWCMREGAWQACDLDGASLQEKATALGLLVATKYDPEIHGPAAEAYPGCDWFVFSDEIKAMLSASPPAPAGTETPR